MSKANPIAAMIQISQAVRLSRDPSGAAGFMLDVIGGIVPGPDASFQAGIQIFEGWMLNTPEKPLMNANRR